MGLSLVSFEPVTVDGGQEIQLDVLNSDFPKNPISLIYGRDDTSDWGAPAFALTGKLPGDLEGYAAALRSFRLALRVKEGGEEVNVDNPDFLIHHLTSVKRAKHVVVSEDGEISEVSETAKEMVEYGAHGVTVTAGDAITAAKRIGTKLQDNAIAATGDAKTKATKALMDFITGGCVVSEIRKKPVVSAPPLAAYCTRAQIAAAAEKAAKDEKTPAAPVAEAATPAPVVVKKKK